MKASRSEILILTSDDRRVVEGETCPYCREGFETGQMVIVKRRGARLKFEHIRCGESTSDDEGLIERLRNYPND